MCSSTSSWPRLLTLWAGCLIIHAVGGGGTEILFSAYLGIYGSTECNITVRKQDPNHPNQTISLSFSVSCLVLILSVSLSVSPSFHYSSRKSGKCPQPPPPETPTWLEYYSAAEWSNIVLSVLSSSKFIFIFAWMKTNIKNSSFDRTRNSEVFVSDS